MKSNSNQILIGIIVIMLGAFSLLKKSIAFDFSALTITVVGLAFLLLYRQKKAVWALFVGAYISWAGLWRLMSWFGLSEPRMFAGLFFAVPGAVFMFLYFDKNKRGLLVPGSLLLWIGAGLCVANMFSLGVRASLGVIVMCIGLSLCCVYFIGMSYLSRWLLNLGITTAVLGVLLLTGIVGGISRFVSYALIAIGVGIIVKSLIYKPR